MAGAQFSRGFQARQIGLEVDAGDDAGQLDIEHLDAGVGHGGLGPPQHVLVVGGVYGLAGPPRGMNRKLTKS